VKVLHLISNWKLTGPVDPALRLARALGEIGLDSRVAIGAPGADRGPLDQEVRERGLEPLTSLRLSKHRRVLGDLRDVRALARLLREDPVDVIHVHLDNAHGIAARARRRSRVPGEKGPLIVRSLYDDRVPPSSPRYRRLFGSECDGVFVFGSAIRSGLLERFAVSECRVRVLSGAVLTDRFHPRRPEETLRERFGIPLDAVVVGIVARIQRHRRYSVLFEAMRRVMARLPNVYLLVLGRGTHAKEIAHDTVERLGIGERTRLPGYVGGDEYPVALACFDLKVFLVPGSDGTCRAVREALACGIPVVVSQRGLLPEMVRDGVDGCVIEDDEDTLAATVGRLAEDGDLRRQMGRNALERARTEFSQRAQADVVRDAYGVWLET
jgi:glycosyltransferase involved in cell wall biosynthesis